MSSDGRYKKEIMKRVCHAEVAFNKKRIIVTPKNINLSTRENLLKTCIWSIMLLGRELWNVTSEKTRRIEAFEIWCYRWTEEISWTDRITNEELLERVSDRKSIWKSIQNRWNELVDHILRHSRMLWLIVEGTIAGKNHRRRPR